MAIQMKTQSAQPDFRRLKPHWELYCVLTRHNAIHRNLPVFPHWKWIQHEFGPMRYSGGQGYWVHYFFGHSIFILLFKLKWSLHIYNVKKKSERLSVWLVVGGKFHCFMIFCAHCFCFIYFLSQILLLLPLYSLIKMYCGGNVVWAWYQMLIPWYFGISHWFITLFIYYGTVVTWNSKVLQIIPWYYHSKCT